MSEIINTSAGAPLGFTIPGQGDFGLIGGLFAGTDSARQRLWAGWGRRVRSRRKPRLMFAYGRSHSSGCFYAIAPTSHPMHAVIAIARPPQNATRIAPLITLASPARAASPPISARTVCDDRETNGINCAFGAITSDHEWHQRTESKAACSGKGCLQWARAKLLGDQPQARSCGRDRWSPGRPALLLAEIEDEDCWRQLAVASVLVNGPIREHA